MWYFPKLCALTAILKIKSKAALSVANMENIQDSQRAFVSLSCHSLLNKAGVLFPRWGSHWTTWGLRYKKNKEKNLPVATKTRSWSREVLQTSYEGHFSLFVLSGITVCRWLLESDVQLPVRWLLHPIADRSSSSGLPPATPLYRMITVIHDRLQLWKKNPHKSLERKGQKRPWASRLECLKMDCTAGTVSAVAR